MQFRCLAFRGVEPESFRVWWFTGLDFRAAGVSRVCGIRVEGSQCLGGLNIWRGRMAVESLGFQGFPCKTIGGITSIFRGVTSLCSTCFGATWGFILRAYS